MATTIRTGAKTHKYDFLDDGGFGMFGSKSVKTEMKGSTVRFRQLSIEILSLHTGLPCKAQLLKGESSS